MKTIELENWAPIPGDPQHVQYVGPRTAQEVFEELSHRLDSIGYLPDEYFLLDDYWQNGREIPKDADLFCTTDYGESEGIYLDIYLKWYEDGKPITKSFITGKTLGDTGSDLDRMFLIGSAVTKAFHGDGGSYSRYLQIGGNKNPEGCVLHLNAEEKRLLLDALVEKRTDLEDKVLGIDRIIRRMTDSITEYIDEVGQRPANMSDLDRAMLAIQDGDLKVFRDSLPKVQEHIGELLVQAAGRPGMAGRKMSLLALTEAKSIPNDIYLAACKEAVNTADLERVLTFTDQADLCVRDMDPAIYGDVIAYAYHNNHRNISGALLEHCTPEQISQAKSTVLGEAALEGDLQTMTALVKKGIDSTSRSREILNRLYANHNGWMAEALLRDGMKVDLSNVAILHDRIEEGELKGATLLVDLGMDFEEYLRWKDHFMATTSGHDDTLQSLKEHWENTTAAKDQDCSGQVLD